MKKIFIQQNYKYITVNTLENEYSEHSCMYDAIQKVFNLKDDSSLIIMDIDKKMYNVLCEELALNKNFYKHITNVMSMNEIEKMRRMCLTLCGYWKMCKK